MEPTQTPHTPLQPTPGFPPPVENPAPQKPKNRLLMWVGIGVFVLIVLVGLTTKMENKSKQAASPVTTAKPASQVLTVGSVPYVYACSITTVEDFNRIFGFNGPDTIGTVTSKSSLRQALSSSETDLNKIAPYGQGNGYSSTCELVVTTTPEAKTFATIDTTVDNFATNNEAMQSLTGTRRFNQRDSQPPLPTLPSFPNSLVILPSQQGASHTIKATAQHNTILFTIEYRMADNETVDTALPKMDAFAKAALAKADDASIATKPSTLDGRTTMLGRPFINTCTSIGLTDVAQKLGGINLRPDEITHIGQYGALNGSHAAEQGVLSSCRLTFRTAAEAAKAAANSSSSSGKSSSSYLAARTLYPHTLLIGTNRYASADAAKAALTAKKDRQRQTIPNIQDVQIGDGGYKLHNETAITNYSGSSPQTTIVEDAYTLQDGPNLIFISVQQIHKAETSPAAVTDAQIQDVYQLGKNMLAK